MHANGKNSPGVLLNFAQAVALHLQKPPTQSFPGGHGQIVSQTDTLVAVLHVCVWGTLSVSQHLPPQQTAVSPQQMPPHALPTGQQNAFTGSLKHVPLGQHRLAPGSQHVVPCGRLNSLRERFSNESKRRRSAV
jgi:hypothetical protein